MCAVSEPLVKVLRLIDGDKPAMGYLYEAMDRAKETIRNYYVGKGACCSCNILPKFKNFRDPPLTHFG